MTMELISKNEDSIHTKPMNTMKDGEVCYCPEVKRYVVKVNYSGTFLFLILINDDGTNSYSDECPLPVRELREGESVTVKFS